MNLLLVDDDVEVLNTVVGVLEDAGFSVMSAANAEDAIRQASRSEPDVLVTDLDLGAGMNGIELAIEVRRRWPRLPIVYISGRQWLMNGHVLDEREVFLPKPFRQQTLVGGVHAVSGGIH